MFKIFKYSLYEDDNKWFYDGPKGLIIRTDFVNDGYYHGHFVWVIVDTKDNNIFNIEVNRDLFEGNKQIGTIGPKSILIGVLENQKICCQGKPIGCFEYQGKFFLSLNSDRDYYQSTIRLYKTGQEIQEDLDSLSYLGFMKLWIKQELGLYCFVTSVEKVY